MPVFLSRPWTVFAPHVFRDTGVSCFSLIVMCLKAMSVQFMFVGYTCWISFVSCVPVVAIPCESSIKDC